MIFLSLPPKQNKPLLTWDKINITNYTQLTKFNYTILDIQRIAAKHNWNLKGKKKLDLLTYLYTSFCALKIQTYVRGFFHRQYVRLHGPGFWQKNSCNNEFDVLSLDELTKIPYNQFFSYQDEDGFIYGFDIISFIQLIEADEPVNPFNKKPIMSKVKDEFNKFLDVSEFLQIPIQLSDTSIDDEISDKKWVELQIVSLFQQMDYYANPEWFLCLSKQELHDFLLELMDIWFYRANIPKSIRCEICPPHGDPFISLLPPNHIDFCRSKTRVRYRILECLQLIADHSLGALYILSALTLVNSNAATSLPWLFESVEHINVGNIN
jgi:hypothetical protein